MERRLQAMPLSCVRVTDAFAHNALEREIDYLLSLQEGRLLAGFYENAGLKTSFVRYGGWEDMLIGGHTLGHYLTALAQAYVNPAVSEEKRSMGCAATRIGRRRRAIRPRGSFENGYHKRGMGALVHHA